MANTINNGQSGASWLVNKVISENKKAYGEFKEILWGKPPEATDGQKASQDSAKVRTRNSVEGLERMYETKSKKQHACLDSIQDSIAFSPEALAMMGA